MTKKSLETKPLRTLKGKKLSGSLATPIDAGLRPFTRKDITGEDIGQRLDEIYHAHAERNASELHRQRMAKMPDLARQLGVKFEHLNLTKDADRALFYGSIAENLAALLIPGFQETRAGKWPFEMVFQILCVIQDQKRREIIGSDLEGCIEIIKQIDPELARPQNRSQLERKARSLRNRVARERAERMRFLAQQDCEELEDSPEPSVRVVK